MKNAVIQLTKLSFRAQMSLLALTCFLAAGLITIKMNQDTCMERGNSYMACTEGLFEAGKQVGK